MAPERGIIRACGRSEAQKRPEYEPESHYSRHERILLRVACHSVDMTTRRRQPTFSEIVSEVNATPVPPAAKTYWSGGLDRDGETWADPSGTRYLLVTEALDPVDAVQLARQGALVVYDSCGCGGQSGCDLDGLSADDVAELGKAAPPRVGRPKRTWGRLAHYRSAQGRDLVAVAVNVNWGDRITFVHP